MTHYKCCTYFDEDIIEVEEDNKCWFCGVPTFYYNRKYRQYVCCSRCNEYMVMNLEGEEDDRTEDDN